MNMPDFLPTREAELVVWSTNFNTLINATPTTYGLTEPQATGYETLHSAFDSAFQASQDPTTRTPANIVAKNTAMNNLRTNARLLARIIQAAPAVTDEMKAGLGLTVRKTEPSPINPPTELPVLEVTERFGAVVRIKLHDGSGSRRGKPDGVQGASVFSYVGATPPADASGWKFEGNTTKTITEVEFPAGTAPGTTVYLTAFWYNPRGQSGPGCAPVSTNIAGGAVQQAA
jgi:hypothetical protein